MIGSVGKERSSINPSDAPERSKKELKFSYNTAEYDSYAKQGFTPPETHYRPDKFEVLFLLQTDPGKGKVKVRITRMFRLKAIDYATEKEQVKEYLYYETDWKAKNWLGKDLAVHSHVEGKYNEQTKRLELGDFDSQTGQRQMYYVKGVPRLVYCIPFSKKAVDSIINNEHPFGPDSINVTDKDKIEFYGKFDNTTESQAFNCGGYTYEQFITPEWKAFFQLATRKGGPSGLPPDQLYTKNEEHIQ